jgi:O-antigen/teichoic acid export membrane protein
VHFLGTGGSADRIILIISAATAFRILEVIDFYFQARVIARYSAISSGCALIASSLLKIYLITRNAPLIAFAWAFLFDAAVINGLYLHFYRHAGGTLKALRFRVQQAARLLSDSWPLIFSGLMISIYMKIDQVMVQHYMGDWYVGQYAAAVKLCDAWLFITVVITNSLFPAIVKAREVSVELFRERMTRLYKLLVFISLVISCVVFLFSRQIVLHTYGADFSNAIPLLQLYVWSIIFVFLNNASWKWYIAENLQRIAMLRLCLGAIVNIGLNMLLIPEFGLQGAAYATLVSYILATYLGNALHRGTRENFRMQTRAILTFYTFNR